ncbi:MAG: FecR domain-containing protein [Bacteriovoracaceae bacterium]|nr:FecR domain-containing protein [Bacteriovoracaceae bacterium]
MKFFLISILLMFQVANASELAEIIYVKGTVKVVKTDETSVLAYKGMKLKEGEEVETQTEALAIVSFLGNSKIKIDPNSKLKIEDFKPKVQKDEKSFTRFYLKWGAVVIDFFNNNKEHELEIKTTQVAMAVRGTNFFVGYGEGEEKGDIYTVVNEGKVSALNYTKDDHEDIPPGKGVMISKDGAISKAQKFSWAKNMNWKMNANKKMRSGFRNNEARKERVKKRRQRLMALRKKLRRPFMNGGKFKNWVKNRDRIKKKLQKNRQKRQENRNKVRNGRKNLRKKMRNNWKKRRRKRRNQ